MTKLDAFDIRILAALQREGRMTKLKLAETIHLSPAACWERLRRLEEAGIITGYTARLNAERIARMVTAIVEVTLKSHRHADFAKFEAAVRAEPHIVECHATGGGIDYFLRVVCADIEAYQDLIERLLLAEIGIDRYFTYLVTKSIKLGDIPVEQLAAGSRT